ncbi:MAG TPA: hypothetical protein VMJ70_03135, partial [Candidatus Sulfotelmatobacter sp.]|nr:hypothetical protein [Candidatus Sulfotelmatobacter sp.]
MAAHRPHSARFTLALALLSLSLGATSAHAIPISWASAVSGNWNDPTKWSPPQVPTAADDASITAAGTYTVTLNVDGSVNSLTLGTTSGAQTLSGNSHSLTLASASTVASNGVLDLTSGNLNGAGSLTNQGSLVLRAANAALPLDNFGLIEAHGNSALNGALTTEAGSTLRATGDGAQGGALLTVLNGFTNNGALELTNVAAGQGATFNVTNGTLTNAASASINVLAGAGGGFRTIGAQLD